jgi:enoyl-CoA hydratase/carnithine racemase
VSNYETIDIDVRGDVHWLTLNRPDRLNAINTQMATELGRYFGDLYQDRSCRVVVMQGAGRAFCAGLDIKDPNGLKGAPFGGGFGFQGHLADVYVKMRRCPQPIISLIQGAASGGGFAFADRALSIGLVNEVVPDSGLAKAGQVFVDEMLATSPMGLRLTKEGLNMSIDAGSLEAAMAIENRNQVLCSGTEDFKEGLQAFVEKRTPRYSDS